MTSSTGRPISPRRQRAGSEQDKAERRAQLLHAAKTTFSRSGYHTTTIADVARTAGVSYGSIYWYFDSKDALFEAVVETEGEALRTSILDAIAEGGSSDLDEALVLAVRAVFEHFGADHDAARLLIRDAANVEFSSRFLGDLAAIVADAQRTGHTRQGPPEAIAFSFAALVGQFVQRRLHTDDGLSDADAARFVVSVLLDGVRSR